MRGTRIIVACAVAFLALWPIISGQALCVSPAPGEPVLERAAEGVATFLSGLSDVECTEVVSQIGYGKNGKVEYEEHSTFDYVVLSQSGEGKPSLVESRLPKQTAPHRKNFPLLVTNGFSTLLLVFHPYYQSGFEFSPPVEELLDGKRYLRVNFRHIKGMRTTAALLERGREFPLDLAGSAWIDESSGAIAKVSAGLESSMADMGLKDFHAEVQYAPVAFRGKTQTFWLPASAVIDVESNFHRWRNVHEFTAYHLFSTSVETKVGPTP